MAALGPFGPRAANQKTELQAMPEDATTSGSGVEENTSRGEHEKASSGPVMIAITMDKRVEMV